MLAAILRAHSATTAVLATEGNLNNAIGLPLTLLRLRAAHRAAVIELGMNHRGETRELAAIARPTIVVVNNAQREHQEFMASVAEVAAEHADAIAALPRGRHRGRQRRRRARRRLARRGARRRARASSTFGFDRCRRRARATARCAPDGSDVDARDAGRRRARRRLRVPGPAHGRAMRSRRRRRRCGAGASLAAVARGLDGVPRRCRGRLVALRAPAGARRARRHLQRESGFGARGDRRARGGARRALARAGRHGRGRRARSGVPSRDRRVRARARHRRACSRSATLAREAAAAFGDGRRALRDRRTRSRRAVARDAAAGVTRAGQGLALHADGARRRRADRPRRGRRRTDAAAAHRVAGAVRSARSTCSATSRCARCWRR